MIVLPPFPDNNPPHGVVYLLPGTVNWTVPLRVHSFTVECWGPGCGNGLSTGGGGGAYTRTSYTGQTPGAVIPVHIETGNIPGGGDVWTWFSTFTTQRAHGGLDSGIGGRISQSIGDVIYAGGNAGPSGGGPGGGGAAGPGGTGRNGGDSPGAQPGGGGGGGQGGGTDGADGATGPLGAGGNGGSNALGQLGGAPGIDGPFPGTGGGGTNFNGGVDGGKGADDQDGGGGGGGGDTENVSPRKTGGNGGFPGGGAGNSTHTAIGAGGQIKITY